MESISSIIFHNSKAFKKALRKSTHVKAFFLIPGKTTLLYQGSHGESRMTEATGRYNVTNVFLWPLYALLSYFHISSNKFGWRRGKGFHSYFQVLCWIVYKRLKSRRLIPSTEHLNSFRPAVQWSDGHEHSPANIVHSSLPMHRIYGTFWISQKI